MRFSSSYYSQIIYRTGFLPPFFDFHVIYRLPFSIPTLFTGSLFWFPCYFQAPFFDLHVLYRLAFSIYTLFTGSLFPFTCYLQAPFFHLHVIYRLPFLIYTSFTGSCFHFPCSLQPPFFYLHVIYSIWHPLCIKFTCYLQVSRLNHKKFTGYLQYLQEQFTCYLHDLSPLCWNIYSVFFIIYMFHLKYLHVFYMKPPKHVKGEKSCKLIFTVSFWLFTC